MRKKYIAVFLVFVLLFGFTGCDSSETGVEITVPTKVSVGIDSTANIDAARDYVALKGYELVEYESHTSAIIATENGVTDYVILNSDYVTREFLQSVDLEFVENTTFKTEYCAYFKNGNEELLTEFDSALNELKSEGVIQKIFDTKFEGGVYVPQQNSSENGTITVLCAPIFEERLFYEENGNITGTDYFILQEICARMSVGLKIKTFKDINMMFSALDKGEGDVVFSSVEYTPERASQFLCSDIYSQTTFGVYKSSLS